MDASALARRDRVVPSRLGLFLTFAQIGICGFGGVGPWARRIIVEDRGWVSEHEYAEVLGLCAVLPGPNVGNVATCIGDRFHGPLGSMLALVGLLCGPLSVLLGLAVLYDRFGDLPVIHAAIGGVAAAAAGLFLGTGLRMGQRLKLRGAAVVITGCAFVGMGVLRWPLLVVVLVLAPISFVLAWRSQP